MPPGGEGGWRGRGDVVLRSDREFFSTSPPPRWDVIARDAPAAGGWGCPWEEWEDRGGCPGPRARWSRLSVGFQQLRVSQVPLGWTGGGGPQRSSFPQSRPSPGCWSLSHAHAGCHLRHSRPGPSARRLPTPTVPSARVPAPPRGGPGPAPQEPLNNPNQGTVGGLVPPGLGPAGSPGRF